MSGIIKGGLTMDRFCRKCKSYIAHDENFGYCIRYKCQARQDDTCKIILEMVNDE